MSQIAVLCCTYGRPRMLEQVLWCFEQQTYRNAELIALDDSSTLPEAEGERWRVVRHSPRFPALGAKRNHLTTMAPDADILVVWDDDDWYQPWALEAIAAALENAAWCRPSEVCVRSPGRLKRVRTWNRIDHIDKAFQCSWGIRREAFLGYDAGLSRGEDCDLAWRMVITGVPECDPIKLGFEPYYIWGPHGNVHLTHKPYDQWAPPPESVESLLPAAVDIPPIGDRLYPRPGPRDWFADAGLPL